MVGKSDKKGVGMIMMGKVVAVVESDNGNGR